MEGRVDEHAAATVDLREGQREIFDQMNSRFDGLISRLDRLFFATLGIGAVQIALLITLIVRS